MKKIKQYILVILFGLAGYYLLGHHIIYFGNTLKFLKKSRLTAEYTFVNCADKKIESIMKIDTLREAGIGDLLVSMGILNEELKVRLEKEYDSDPVYY